MKILVVVDMQNDFIEGSLGSSFAQQIVPNVVAKIASYSPEAVFATRDTHNPNYLDTCEGRHLPVVHCVAGTEGHALHTQIISAMSSVAPSHIVDKPTFGSMELAERIRALACDEPAEIELIGLCTGICVLSNAILLKAAMPESEISVDAACCACVTPKSHDTAIAAMRGCHIDVKNHWAEPWR